MSKKYDRLRTYSPGQVLKYVSLNPEDKPRTIKFAGQNVFMGSKRYLNFKRNGLVCVGCGLEGTYFALEKHKYQKTPKYHFNLYGKDKDGEEVMLTKDHIMPKAKGGTDELDNFQPMCACCNTTKGDNWLSSEQLIHKAKVDSVKGLIGHIKNLFDKSRESLQELKDGCPHDIIRTNKGKAVCSVCGTHFGWYCSKSSTRYCKYNDTRLLSEKCKHCGGSIARDSNN